MATLVELVNNGELVSYDADLGFRQQPQRLIYLRPRVIDWLQEVLAIAESERGSEISPAEALAELFDLFCAGEPLMFDRQFHALSHWSHGIWELKTFDVRVFGWFPFLDCFVATSADFKSRIIEHKLYAGYRDEAVRIRQRLNLDEPKFVEGDDPSVVVSNFSFP